ncbi:hypothetical protein BH09ACT7_BH09ACT7_05160 [soil metagenome]
MQTTQHPAHPAADLIVSAGSRTDGTLRDVMVEYSAQLLAAGAFDDLSESDARTLSVIVAWDVILGGEAKLLRRRARAITDGWWQWSTNPAAAAHAFTVAADVLDQL